MTKTQKNIHTKVIEISEYITISVDNGLKEDINKVCGINRSKWIRDVLKEVIKKTPLNRILIETDCPFLTPPLAKAKRNEPIFVRHIAKDIARIKNIPFEQAAERTTQNAQTLFNL